MSSSTPPTNFEIQGIPDQLESDKLVKKMLEHDFEITDDDMYTAHWAIVQQHDALIKKLSEGEPATDGKKAFIGFDPFVNGLHKMHKAAVALRSQFLDPLVASKDKWLKRGQAYKEKRELEARREAEKKAEQQQKQEAKALEKDAAKLEKSGDVGAAEVLREQARNVPVPTVAVQTTLPSFRGQVNRGEWVFVVDDYEKVPDSFKLLDHNKKGERDLIDSKIRAVVSKLGDKIKIEGVRVRFEKSTSSRGVK